jgi:hypothetical protein
MSSYYAYSLRNNKKMDIMSNPAFADIVGLTRMYKHFEQGNYPASIPQVTQSRISYGQIEQNYRESMRY